MPESMLSCVGRRVHLAVVSGVSPIYVLHFTSLIHLLLLKLCQKTCRRHPQSQLQVTLLTITNMTVHMQFFIFEIFTIICYNAISVLNSISCNATSFFDTPQSEPHCWPSPDIFTTGDLTSFTRPLLQPSGSGLKSRFFPTLSFFYTWQFFDHSASNYSMPSSISSTGKRYLIHAGKRSLQFIICLYIN